MKKAFTLIELLVVIAIIAILAAILFPVFAQAKTAAKKAAATSDVKQLVLATIMYSGDADDMNVPKLRVGYGSDQGGGNPEVVMSWDKLIQPYAKNYQLIVSGMDPRTKYRSPYGMVRRSYAVAGNAFKGVQLNPAFGWGTFTCQTGMPTTAMPQPADTVAIGERRQLDRPAQVGGVDLWKHSDWHQEAWMTNSRSADQPAGNKILGEWGQIANKYNNGSVWGFMDGHAAFKRVNGRTADGAQNGTLFPGYEQKLQIGYGSDPNWDYGMSCFDAEWNAANAANDCKLPGQ